MNYLIKLGIRLLTALVLGINFNWFYTIFSPLTFYLSYYTVKLIGYNPLLSENGFYIDNVFLKFIPACTAASAYLLLVLLILLTKDVGFFKGMFLFLFGSFVILILNIIRIDFLIYLLIEYGSNVFNMLHLFIWKVLSSVFVAALWIFMCKWFNVKGIPVYSDFKEIKKMIKLGMAEIQVPDMVNNYLIFCNYRERAKSTKEIDLGWCNWLFPTILLPLGIFIKKHKYIKYLPPHNQNVANYFDLVTGKITLEDTKNKSYLPCVYLPKKRKEATEILECIFKLHNNGKEYGGETVFKYLVSELVDNIYEHSEFENAVVMAQRYDKKGFVEICFFDDGITIPGSFKKKGLVFEDQQAIMEAVNGLSTKGEERGFGLSSNMSIFTKGMDGEVFIVSGLGAVYVGNRQKVYKLKDQHKLEGTLISIRIPIPAPKVNIYDYLN